MSERWLRAAGYDLRFPIGMGAAGPLELDLVDDGPHALIGGTSGAGKSELLQSMVASLAAGTRRSGSTSCSSTTRAGASSAMFDRLPHTVGYVTNLDAGLAMRALTSLRAELNHRMALMEGRAKDLAEMLDVAPDEAPASLVIVVDEFATLVKEVPEFVAGVIDVAQRGRSLGIHLVLATQRPSGSVNENILANTNLRISLRMLDRAESTAVIGSPDAADIPVPLKGRALARLGPHRLVPFQSSWGGAPMVADDVRPPVLIGDFDAPTIVRPALQRRRPTPVNEAPAQLDAVIDAIVDANVALALPTPRRPWCDVLPDVVQLAAVLDDARCDPARPTPRARSSRSACSTPPSARSSGLPRRPRRRRWSAWSSGRVAPGRPRCCARWRRRSRSPAEAAAARWRCSRSTSRRVGLHAAARAADHDRRRVRRRSRGGEPPSADARCRARAPPFPAGGGIGRRPHGLLRFDESLPRIVVLIDQIGGMIEALAEAGAAGGGFSGGEVWADRLGRIVVEGRQVGIHTVIAGDRRNAVPARLHAAISNRLVLRHADEMGYAEHGIPLAVAKDADLAPGRGFWQGTTSVQVAVAGRDASARGQSEAIAAIGADEHVAAHRHAVAVVRSPTSASRDATVVPPTRSTPLPMVAPLGIADVIRHAGRSRSGRGRTVWCSAARGRGAAPRSPR